MVETVSRLIPSVNVLFDLQLFGYLAHICVREIEKYAHIGYLLLTRMGFKI